LRELGVKVYLRHMKVIDCDCGQTLQAANDEDLFKETRVHLDREHADTEMTDDQVRELVSARAYEASDS
jgi:predicted small metal-binding protein